MANPTTSLHRQPCPTWRIYPYRAHHIHLTGPTPALITQPVKDEKWFGNIFSSVRNRWPLGRRMKTYSSSTRPSLPIGLSNQWREDIWISNRKEAKPPFLSLYRTPADSPPLFSRDSQPASLPHISTCRQTPRLQWCCTRSREICSKALGISPLFDVSFLA